ncbi:hypothetical protein OG453_33035 [Streptomyces sp. NBC_01381]|uniref:hypothetical protein n=1 Tax=Streptomyces sp. NBC_01381 TaxID=2903845 RepID=UPI00224E1C63|nr:hypothetical protein [Streptomyces sp. NBC_01381]MCX4671457.1 hypothetical protein [Streptomyces sp. NBC_01381]
MSIPNPPQPGPYQPNPNPNPYQQPPGAVPPQPYGQQPGPYAQQPGPYGQPPAPVGGPPAPPAGPRRPTPGWAWGLGGVVVASALWAGALFATGNLGSGDGGDADFAGHQYTKNLCDATKLEAFQKEYTLDTDSTATTHYGSRQKGLDQSYCSHKLKDPAAAADSYASTYVYSTARWHKTTDPAGEFASEWKAFEDQSQKTYGYTTKAVSGIGDEAYLVTEKSGTDKDSLTSMTLAVRAGWFTIQMHWSSYGAPDDKAAQPKEAEVRKMLETDTRTAMESLKK